MDFVDAHGFAQRRKFSALRHPGLVRPGKFARVPDNGRVFRRHLEEKPVGIRLQANLPVQTADLEFVMRPFAHAEYAAVEDSEFFWRAFDGVVAVGLMFLLPPNVQATVIRKIGSSLSPAGKFLFTSPKEAATWRDILTGRESVSLGAERYLQILHTEGLLLVDEQSDEGGNHYYLASKPHLQIHHKDKIGTMAAR